MLIHTPLSEKGKRGRGDGIDGMMDPASLPNFWQENCFLQELQKQQLAMF